MYSARLLNVERQWHVDVMKVRLVRHAEVYDMLQGRGRANTHVKRVLSITMIDTCQSLKPTELEIKLG